MQHDAPARVAIRNLQERDLASADRIMRVAFGTFVGAPDPSTFMGDTSYIATRWRANPDAAFAAEVDGEIVGSNFATRWGSAAFFGPLTVRADFWDRGIAKALMQPVVEAFDGWRASYAGLFTFPNSPKHLGLYQGFGFWPGFLTVVMAKPVTPAPIPPGMSLFSTVPTDAREACLRECREMTDRVYPGLDVTGEIVSVGRQHLGDTVLLRDAQNLVGLAVCHIGGGTEAGSGTCYVKFAAVAPTVSTATLFTTLLDACDMLANERGAAKIVAGVNTARVQAYRAMIARGFRIAMQGVEMHRDGSTGFNQRDAYVINDLR